MKAKNKKPDAHLADDAFGNEETTTPTSDTTSYQQEQSDGEWGDEPDHDIDEEDYDEGESDEPAAPAPGTKKPKLSEKKRLALALVVALVATVGIIYMLWRTTLSANGFRAGAAPVPTEPIDLAERESKQKNQPTDYADEEQMRTMDYGNVNSIYGLALKKQETNRQQSAQDSARQNPTVQRELSRSQQLTRQQTTRRSSIGTGSNAPTRRYQTESYSSGYGGRAPAYGDPYHANPTREDIMLRSGFNTVKADRNQGERTGDRQADTEYGEQSAAMSEGDYNEPIPGVVSGDQTIMNGTRVMFRTLADAKIRDRFAPKGSILIGFAQVGSNRAVFNITTLRLSTGEAVPVRLRALDPDMNEGLALQSDKPARQQVDQATNNALSQAAGQAAWSAGNSVSQATRMAVAGNALASLGAGIASAATTGRRREVRQKLNLQDGFKVFFIPVK